MATLPTVETLPLEWAGGRLRLLDQTRLPVEVVRLELEEWRQVVESIGAMRVRGAPAVGIAGAFAVVLAGRGLLGEPTEGFRQRLAAAAEEVAGARPTAVNLRWAVTRTVRAARKAASPAEAVALMEREALSILEEDLAACRAIGSLGAALLPEGATMLTHCNAGALATSGYGTALGIARAAWAMGRLRGVIATETRPLFQGARLTAWEMSRDGIPVTVVVDGAAGSLMRAGRVSAVVVGADRVAANGDVANKVGTYPLAVLARAHGLPFYVAAPTSTLDLATGSGEGIPIEERDPLEVAAPMGVQVAPEGVAVLNPAFDITPGEYVSAIVTEAGVVRAPYRESLERLVGRGG